MSIITGRRWKLLGAAVAALALTGEARADLLGLDAQLRARLAAAPGEAGTGAGVLHLPTAPSLGRASGVLVDGRGVTRYVLEAQLTTFIPLYVDRGVSVIFGGIYGELLEVVGGTPDEPMLARGKYVEGMWRVERNLFGVLEGLVFEIGPSGGMVLTGLVQGGFQLVEHEAEGMPSGASASRLRAHRAAAPGTLPQEGSALPVADTAGSALPDSARAWVRPIEGHPIPVYRRPVPESSASSASSADRDAFDRAASATDLQDSLRMGEIGEDQHDLLAPRVPEGVRRSGRMVLRFKIAD